MLWHELTIHTTEEAVEMISNFLHEMGADGVSIEETGSLNRERDTTYGQLYDKPFNDIPEGEAVIKGYFADVTNPGNLIDEIKPRIEELRTFDIDPGSYTMETRIVNEDEWANAWKQYFKPIRVSERLTIKPTWEPYEAGPGEQIIEIDPGMAFGTGTHPTTSLCLRALESVIQGGEEIIDVGTGSGILAIGAVKLGAKHVLALDLDPVAVTIAEENTQLNQLENDITVHLSDLLQVINRNEEENASTPLGVTLPVQIVVANILAEVILLFIDDVYNALADGGTYITSGIYKNKEEVVEQALLAAKFTIVDRYREDDWVAFVARKL
ncbi:50S ribosomal protein L11 methyltransferase [Paenibacillus guangzhouensis]|uniref:50S ribosomal protein L11 methyltransferase n=1 Tax=Paenibacillus guangzhouensis TaxID=1473112 RepID=UPI001266A530|nr:50S ribosomal protein L11 methyltransferase [Paenibacillus guangzhouensis]